MSNPANPDGVQGEGDYKSARRFDDEERAFVKSGKVEQKAREAEQALDGPEGAELEAARKASAEGRSFKIGDTAATTSNAKLDEALKDSFPASDPLPASPRRS